MMLATYTIISAFWVDMPEAKPRARARVKKKDGPDAEIIVNDDGSLTYDPDADIEIDYYESPKYDAIRNEVRLSKPEGAFADKARIIPRGQEGQPHDKPVVQKDK